MFHKNSIFIEKLLSREEDFTCSKNIQITNIDYSLHHRVFQIKMLLIWILNFPIFWTVMINFQGFSHLVSYEPVLNYHFSLFYSKIFSCRHREKHQLTPLFTGNKHYSRIDKEISIRTKNITGHIPVPSFFLFFSDYIS